MRLVRPLILSVLATALAAPAAQAATLQALNPCYRSVDASTREAVSVRGGGFTPGSAVNVAIDGVVVQRDVIALPDGSVSGEVNAPYLEAGVRPFALTLTERDRPQNTATAGSRVTAVELRLRPREARPSSPVRFLGRGFLDGAEIYGHYRRGDKLRRTVFLGRPEGPCGRLNVERRQIPVDRPKTGRWTLQVDNQPTWSAQPPGVFVRLAIQVKRVPSRPPVVAVLAALAAAPAAPAATVASQVACVRSIPGVKTFPLTATGFPAGAALTFKADGAAFGGGQADAAGGFDNALDPFFGPTLPDDVNLRTYQVTAEDGQGTVAGPVAVPVSRTIVVPPRDAKPAQKVRFRVYGFQPGARTYLHVRRAGRTKGRFALGRAAGPCGTLTKRMRFMPLRTYRTGTYRYYFSHSRRFRRDQTRYQARVRIYRTFKPAAAAAQTTAAWG